MNRDNLELDRLLMFTHSIIHTIETLSVPGQYGERLEDGRAVSYWLPDDSKFCIAIELRGPALSIRLSDKVDLVSRTVVTVAGVPFEIVNTSLEFGHQADPEAPLHPFWTAYRWRPAWDDKRRPIKLPYEHIDLVRNAIRDYVAWQRRRAELARIDTAVT